MFGRCGTVESAGFGRCGLFHAEPERAERETRPVVPGNGCVAVGSMLHGVGLAHGTWAGAEFGSGDALEVEVTAGARMVRLERRGDAEAADCPWLVTVARGKMTGAMSFFGCAFWTGAKFAMAGVAAVGRRCSADAAAADGSAVLSALSNH